MIVGRMLSCRAKMARTAAFEILTLMLIINDAMLGDQDCGDAGIKGSSDAFPPKVIAVKNRPAGRRWQAD